MIELKEKSECAVRVAEDSLPRRWLWTAASTGLCDQQSSEAVWVKQQVTGELSKDITALRGSQAKEMRGEGTENPREPRRPTISRPGKIHIHRARFHLTASWLLHFMHIIGIVIPLCSCRFRPSRQYQSSVCTHITDQWSETGDPWCWYWRSWVEKEKVFNSNLTENSLESTEDWFYHSLLAAALQVSLLIEPPPHHAHTHTHTNNINILVINSATPPRHPSCTIKTIMTALFS